MLQPPLPQYRPSVHPLPPAPLMTAAHYKVPNKVFLISEKRHFFVSPGIGGIGRGDYFSVYILSLIYLNLYMLQVLSL